MKENKVTVKYTRGSPLCSGQWGALARLHDATIYSALYQLPWALCRGADLFARTTSTKTVLCGAEILAIRKQTTIKDAHRETCIRQGSFGSADKKEADEVG